MGRQKGLPCVMNESNGTNYIITPGQEAESNLVSSYPETGPTNTTQQKSLHYSLNLQQSFVAQNPSVSRSRMMKRVKFPLCWTSEIQHLLTVLWQITLEGEWLLWLIKKGFKVFRFLLPEANCFIFSIFFTIQPAHPCPSQLWQWGQHLSTKFP